MENALLRVLTIYLTGMTGIWKGIPVGIVLKSHPVEIASLTALGSITTVILLYYFGEPVKKWVLKKWSKEKLERKKDAFSNIMDKYGIIGLGIICPGIFGPITTIIVGLLIVKHTSRLMPYLVIGIILWSFVLTLFAVSGFNIIKSAA